MKRRDLTSIVDECIHCGLCLPSCPTYRVTGLESESPRGRIMLINQSMEETAESNQILEDHLSTCLGCYTCETVCPSGVEYRHLLDHAQTEILKTENSIPLKHRIFMHWMTSPFWRKQIFKCLWVLQRIGIVWIINLFSKFLKGLPQLRWHGFLHHSDEMYPAMCEQKGSVAFFTGCVMETVYPEVHEATIRILQWNGYAVHVPQDQVCCGALHHHLGNHSKAKQFQSKNIDVFANVDVVINNAAGCGAELKTYSEKFPEKVKDIHEFLSNIDLKYPTQSEERSIIYDAPCHLIHAQQIHDRVLNLLDAFKIKTVDFPQSKLCCGAAGSYVLTQKFLSSSILKDKMADIQKCNDESPIVTANPGCQLQLQKGCELYYKDRTVHHLMTVIDQQYQHDSDYRNAFQL